MLFFNNRTKLNNLVTVVLLWEIWQYGYWRANFSITALFLFSTITPIFTPTLLFETSGGPP